jgi:hypothetical protein
MQEQHAVFQTVMVRDPEQATQRMTHSSRQTLDLSVVTECTLQKEKKTSSKLCILVAALIGLRFGCGWIIELEIGYKSQ